MTTGELRTLQARQRRRLTQSAPFSPEWDAAMAAVEDIEELLRARGSEASDAAKSRPPSDVGRLDPVGRQAALGEEGPEHPGVGLDRPPRA
jgi:hypothetical protein